jgi:hypothetical protein
MAAKKSSRKPKGLDFSNDFAEAILKAIRAGGKATKTTPRQKLGNIDGVERSFGGRYKRVTPPTPPKRSGTNQAAPRPGVKMRPVPPSRPAPSASARPSAARPTIPMRTRPPQPPARTTKPAVKGKPKPSVSKTVKPSAKANPRKRIKGMEK